MGKASSAKKVARAARAGGKTKGQRRRIGFPVAMVALVLLGVGLVASARDSSSGSDSPALGDHWHAAYGIFVCDRWVANVPDLGPDQLGIHTHEDGVIHIHPFLASATGKATTLGKFFDQTGMSVTGSSITLPQGGQYEGRKYVNGKTTCGGKKARVVVAYWENALKADGAPTETRTSNISDEHIATNFGAYTIAFLPAGEKIPPPPSAADIEQLATVDGGSGQPIQGAPEQTDLPDESTVPAGEEPPATELPAGEPPASGEPPPSTAPPASTEPAASTEGAG